MSNFGPCAKDCPDRKAGCSASCDISQMTDGGARNCRRAARGKKKMGGAM